MYNYLFRLQTLKIGTRAYYPNFTVKLMCRTCAYVHWIMLVVWKSQYMHSYLCTLHYITPSHSLWGFTCNRENGWYLHTASESCFHITFIVQKGENKIRNTS